MENKIRVFLADSQVLFREGMHFVLVGEEGVEVVGEGTSAEEALPFLEKKAVDVLILSDDMRDMARRIKFAFPVAKFIFVGNSQSTDEQVGEENSVFLTRDMGPEELVAAVRKAGRNNTSSRVPEPEEGNSDSLVSEPEEGNNDSLVSGAGEGIDITRQSLRERLFSLVESL